MYKKKKKKIYNFRIDYQHKRWLVYMLYSIVDDGNPIANESASLGAC